MDWTGFMVFLLIVGMIISYAVAPILNARRAIAANTPKPEKPTTTRTEGAHVPQSYQRTAPVDAAPVVLVPVIERDRTALFTIIPPEVRGHTAIGAKPGDGKTQTSIALMVQDIARGAQVYWLNPQYTYYHPDDQPTDLTPIKHLFTVVEDYAQILATLQAAHALGEQRKPLYRAGQNVGHNIVLYLDEWPAIYAELGDPVSDVLQRILRECRKLNIWIVLCAQDFLVATTGFSSGVRAAFNTKLVGNVDITTWNTLLGGSVPKQSVTKGTWMTEDGLAEVVRPSNLLIGNMARLTPRPYAPLVSMVSTDDFLAQLIEQTDTGTGTQEPDDDDLSVSTASTTTSTRIEYQSGGKTKAVYMTEERAAAIEKWLTIDQPPLTANQIIEKLGAGRNPTLAMVAYVRKQLQVRTMQSTEAGEDGE